MASYDEELLRAASDLLVRRQGQGGRLAGARVRRSVSTSYYALFHFLLEEAGRNLIGSRHDLRHRRRTLARIFTHRGMKTALDKVRGKDVDPTVADLLRPRGSMAVAVSAPRFATEMAAAFSDAQTLRHEADYDLNAELGEEEARRLLGRVQGAIAAWRAANAPVDRDFKHALCMLMLLGGKLRREP